MPFVVTGGHWEDRSYWESYVEPDWDAGARSIATLEGGGAFSFSVGKAVGIICGLNSLDESADYLEIEHAFYIENGQTRIIENGIYKTAFTAYTTLTSVFKIERIGTSVTYTLDGDLLYTSSLPSTGTVFLDCSLFAKDDTIILLDSYSSDSLALTLPKLTVALEEGITLAIELPTLHTGFIEDANFTYISLVLNPLSLYLDEAIALSVSLPKPTLYLEEAIQLHLTLPSLTLSAMDDETSYSHITLPKLTVALREVRIIPDASQMELILPKITVTINEAEDLSLEITLPKLLVVGTDLDSYCQIQLSPLAVGLSEGVSDFFLLGWPSWTFSLFDAEVHGALADTATSSDTMEGELYLALVCGVQGTDLLEGFITAPLFTEAPTLTTLTSDLALQGTLADSVTTDAAVTVVVAAPLADSQASTDTFTTRISAPLALAAPSTTPLAGALNLQGTLADRQPSLLGFGSIAQSVLTESQATTLALTATIAAPLVSGQPTLDGLASDLTLQGTLADAQASATSLYAGVSGDLTDSQATTLGLAATTLSAPLRLVAPSASPVTGTLELLTALAETQAQTDTLISWPGYALAESQASTDALTGPVVVAGAIPEAPALTDTLGGIIAIYAGLTDSNASVDTLSSALTLIGLLAESAVGGDSFAAASQTVYAINADTGAVSEYVLTPILQGAAFFEGTLFLATDAGLFALDNTTDNGTPIEWEARTGFTNLGSDLLKRITDLNILGQATGDVGVNLVHNRLGEKVERRYERIRLTRTAPRDGIVKTGRGPVSVYWQAGVEGIGPAEISELRLRVEVTSRRR